MSRDSTSQKQALNWCFPWSPRQESNLRPAVYKLQDVRVGSYRLVPESAFEVVFRDSAVSPSTCG
jgi:hypothetical protein